MKNGMLALGMTAVMNIATAADVPDNFLWGRLQLPTRLRATNKDGKGRSVWDYYIDEKHLAGPGISGSVAINFTTEISTSKIFSCSKSWG